MQRILLALLLAVPAAMAHGGASDGDRMLPPGEFLSHIHPVEAELAPGAARNWTMAYGGPAGGVLHEGWYWLLRGDVEGSVRARLSIDGQSLESWLWGDGPQQKIVRVPFDGFLGLRLENVGEENATVRFYYDQTCDCLGKLIPATDGPVWFNADAEAGDQVRFNFTVEPLRIREGDAPPPGNLTVRARHLVPDGLGGFVPKQEVSHNWSLRQDPSCGQGQWSACFDFSIVAQEDGMQLVLVEGRHDGDAAWGTGVRPLIDAQPAGRDSPGAFWTLPLAFALARRRRSPAGRAHRS